ncbi:fimbria/pilus outer membrane usher protein [Burkholderia ubonensis]|uniref:Fimbrial protein n=1 Tax=Burkholderia ubonensis TaxID=101571 RepID=A0AAW3NAR9_9BURK|nr:fimbria/pilus outer membrane usher protein [Burkholderia ubonensis]KVT51273.1 fimbrial protein [Burkholderia ubonensis]
MTKTVQSKNWRGVFRVRPVCAAILSVFSAGHAVAWAAEHADAPAIGAEVEFDKGFFVAGSSAAVNIGRFESGNMVMPGTYLVDLYVNDLLIGKIDVTFRKPAGANDDANAMPCFDMQMLMRAGVDLAKLAPQTVAQLDGENACLPIGRIVEDATTTFDLGDQRLELRIPQISLSRNPRGYVNPKFWDGGVNAGFVGYDANLYTYHTRGMGAQAQAYVGLSTGVNLGAWHFRHNGSYNWSERGEQRYQSIATYVQRDLPTLSSQLIIGESYTSGELFDSTAYRGVRIATDDRMLPDSLRGYAPTVRGVANSNAKVTIKQNNVVIYDTTVAPGAFEIDDLYATGYGGDLTVDVAEADGSVHSFKVPYAAVPLSLRPGITRYSFTAGTVRNAQLSGNPFFMQGTWQRGLTNLLTSYAGGTVSQGYGAVLAGVVLNTDLGAFGFDYTQAFTSIPGRRRFSGGSARISYAKDVQQTGTSISIAAYRYSTGGFFDLNAAMQARDESRRSSVGFDSVLRTRNRAQVTLAQRLGENGGQMSLTASTVNYWNRNGSDVNYSFGYSNGFRNLSYSLQITRQRMSTGQQSTLYYASLLIPLGRKRPVTVNSSVSRDSSGRTQLQTMLSGSLGRDHNLSYGVTVNHASDDTSKHAGGAANLLYRSSIGEFSAAAGAGTGYSQGSIGMRGAVVAHPGGLTASQPLSETFGIVEAKGAAGARLINASGVTLDRRGYAVVPYLTPYSLNSIDLDPLGLSTDVELKVTSQQIAPHAGAISLLKFGTETGRSMAIHATRPDGALLPFGATVLDERGNAVGTVGQASKIYVRLPQNTGTLAVRWGDEPESLCHFSYNLPVRDSRAKFDGYQRADATCR